MSSTVNDMLDKAKVLHRLSSDYKLALVMGVSSSSLTSYRHGKTLPDARVIRLICDLTGDDPAVVAAEIEADRAKNDEARELWSMVARRLRTASAAGIFSALLSVQLAAFSPSVEARPRASTGHVDTLYIVRTRRRRCRASRAPIPAAAACPAA